MFSEHSNPTLGRIVNSIAARFLNGITTSLSCLQLGEKEHRVAESCGIIIWFMCFVGYGVLLQRLLKIFYELPDLICLTFPVFGLLAWPSFFCHNNYIYDPAVLFLFLLSWSLLHCEWAEGSLPCCLYRRCLQQGNGYHAYSTLLRMGIVGLGAVPVRGECCCSNSSFLEPFKAICGGRICKNPDHT